MVLNKIIELLDKEKVSYKLSVHEEVRTSEEAAKIRGTNLSTGAKALVVKLDKNTFSLLVLPANKKLDWKKIKSELKVKKPRLATTEEAEEITKCKVGGIPPFGNILNLKTYFDKSLNDLIEVNFNAGLKTHSINMKRESLVDLVKPEQVDIAA